MITEQKLLLKDEFAKQIFRSEDCKEYVATVISVLLHLKKEDVLNNLVLMNPEVNVNKNVKNQEVDVVYDTDDNYVNIEINYRNSQDLRIKNNAYIAQLYLKQIKSGENYPKIKPIVQININNYDYYKKKKFIYHSYVMEEEYHLARDKNIEIFDINVDLLTEIDYNEIEKLNERDLKWLLYIFVCGDKSLREEVYGESEMMKKVNQKVENYGDPLDAYLFYDKKAMDEAGIKQMIVDDTHKETAKKMLEDNLDMDLIIKYTGLTQDEIEDLKKEKE